MGLSKIAPAPSHKLTIRCVTVLPENIINTFLFLNIIIYVYIQQRNIKWLSIQQLWLAFYTIILNRYCKLFFTHSFNGLWTAPYTCRYCRYAISKAQTLRHPPAKPGCSVMHLNVVDPSFALSDTCCISWQQRLSTSLGIAIQQSHVHL